MSRLYVLACCGFDRPGGRVTREVAELLAASDKECIVGSIAALVNERPGEMREFRAARVICLDGCSVSCATKIAEARGATILRSIDVTRQTDLSASSPESVIDAVTNIVRSLLRQSDDESSRPVVATTKTQYSGDFLIEKIDKFTLRVKNGLYYSDNDFWVSIEGENVRVGATDILQQMVSDIYYIELVEVGREVSLGDDIGKIESTKTVMEVISPISGVIVERNTSLESSPELINESPYERGWLYVIRPQDVTELELLKNATEYMRSAIDRARHTIGKTSDNHIER